MRDQGAGSPEQGRALRVRVTIGGRTYEAVVELLGVIEGGAPSAPAVSSQLEPAPGAGGRATGAAGVASGGDAALGGGTEVRAALPGVVSEVRVAAGQAVAAGDVLLVLEAMKMDNDVMAPVPGRVREVRVQRGEQVAAHQVLAVVE